MPGIGEEDLERARPYIQAALDRNGRDELTVEEVEASVRGSRMQLWAGVTSAIVTELVDLPRGRVLQFTLAGGNQPELQAMMPVIEDWGRAHGATKAVMAGRLGWQRSFLTHEGWRPTRIIMEKQI